LAYTIAAIRDALKGLLKQDRKPAPSHLLDIENIWKAMQTETLRGIPLSEVIGGGDPRAVADVLMTSIDNLMPIQPGASVLDVGCGCGRMAAALIPRRLGSYVGIDIVHGLIDFAKRYISTYLPNFEFYVRNQTNPSYDYFVKKHDGINFISDVIPVGSVDSCIATSLFTHMDYPDAVAMLKEIARAMKPGGLLFMTCFVKDDAALAAINNPAVHSVFKFLHPSPSGMAWIERDTEPSYAVAMTMPQLVNMLSDSGLMIRKINLGLWSGASGRTAWQDEVVIGKS
jgi:SAM-dependent methyltransferase